ncbi:hypothetical protein JHK82_045702 [Glycine max]|uniref:Secreted protein n=1 Tax=Glycine max TaxID=3847 RepID=A0A0R0FJJ5_SOYBN|nr:hypothetical protein JHK86_044033 [Glycine max]KAG5100650.1 hypothetical protein JHK82_045702 [Glycine max]KAH1204437.1 hypothetical protein GmHk_16G045389 [Glycine max]
MSPHPVLLFSNVVTLFLASRQTSSSIVPSERLCCRFVFSSVVSLDLGSQWIRKAFLTVKVTLFSHSFLLTLSKLRHTFVIILVKIQNMKEKECNLKLSSGEIA